MTKQQHTQGPWVVGNRNTMLGVSTPDGRMIANTHGATRNRDMEGLIAEQDANARLIAAAPNYAAAAPRAVEMLRIAADVIRNQNPGAHYKYDGADCDGYCIADDCESAAEDLTAAIAKAEGLE